MRETKRMHFVPRTYLEKFAIQKRDEYHIAAWPKAGGSIIYPNVSNICTEKDLYLLPGETEAERQLLENMYNDLYEKGYNSLYALLTDTMKETITLQQRYSIVGFVVSLLYRNNAWHQFANQVTDDMIRRAYTLSQQEWADSFFFEDREISIAGKSMEELQKAMRAANRPAVAKASADAMFRLIRLRVLTDIVTIVKARPGHEFLTSDNPVWFRAADIKQRPIPFDPTNTLGVPINSQYLLQLQPWHEHFPLTMLGRSSEPIPGVMTSINNNYQHCQCSRFLLGSEAALRAFQEKPSGIIPQQP